MARISYTEGYSDKSVLKQIYDVKRDIDQLWEDKQDVLTAGNGIRIENGVVENTEIPDVDKAYVDNAIIALGADMDDLDDEIVRVQNAVTGLGQEIARVEGEIPDVSGLATKTEVNTGLAGKQNTLVSGTNIKTINGESLLGNGDIVIQGGGGMTPHRYTTWANFHADVMANPNGLMVYKGNYLVNVTRSTSNQTIYMAFPPLMDSMSSGGVIIPNGFSVNVRSNSTTVSGSGINLMLLRDSSNVATLEYSSEQTNVSVTDLTYWYRGGSMRISYKEGYDDQSVLKQLWDDRVDIEDLQMGTMQYPVDTEIDRTSRFPVQNQVIARALDGKQDAGDYVDHVTLDMMLANYVTEMQLTDTVTLIDDKLAGKQDVGDYVTSDVMDERLRGYATVQDVGIMRDNLTMEIDGKMDKDVLIRKIHVGSANPPDAGIGENGDLYIWRP